LASPKFTDAITGFVPSSFSASVCQEIESFPLRYKFNNTLLKITLHFVSIFLLISIKSFVQGFGLRVIPEKEYGLSLSPYHAVNLGNFNLFPYIIISSCFQSISLFSFSK